MPPMPKHENPKDIRLTAPVELRANGNGADALPSTFTGVAYSGGVAPSHNIVIDLDSTNVPESMALLYQHDHREIVGLVKGASKSADHQLIVAGSLFSDMAGSQAERIAQLSKREFPFQMSIGLFGYSEEWVPAGVSTTVNGRVIPGPITVLRNGTVRESSIVTLGADHRTSAQFFSQPDSNESGSDNDNATDTGNTAMTIEQLTAKVAELTATNVALAADLKAATDKAAEQVNAAEAAAKAQRETDVTALFAELGEKPADAERASFVAMSAGEFSATATRLRAMQAKLKKADPKLFSDTVVGDAGTEGDKTTAKVVNLSDIYTKRREQAAKTA